jgi:hypothetical protein
VCGKQHGRCSQAATVLHNPPSQLLFNSSRLTQPHSCTGIRRRQSVGRQLYQAADDLNTGTHTRTPAAHSLFLVCLQPSLRRGTPAVLHRPVVQAHREDVSRQEAASIRLLTNSNHNARVQFGRARSAFQQSFSAVPWQCVGKRDDKKSMDIFKPTLSALKMSCNISPSLTTLEPTGLPVESFPSGDG